MNAAPSIRRPLILRAASALAAGALCAFAMETVAAAPRPLPLARDEAFVVRFAGAARLGQAVGGSLTVTAPVGVGVADPRGRFVAGRPLVDRVARRAVVVRPEALREYFELVGEMTRDDADVQAARVLDRVARTGNVKPLAKIDAALRALLGPSAGTRLDDPTVTAFCPPSGVTDPAQANLRRLIAGDDSLWRSYLTVGDVGAFAQLQQNPTYERFHHPVDPLTGERSSTSVMRQREHRRVLMRRAPNALTFIPEIPMRGNLADAGYAAGVRYDVNIRGPLASAPLMLLPSRGGAIRFGRSGAHFQVALDSGDGGLFAGDTATSAAAPTDAPRIVDMTPPAGESLLDLTTDWEDPDNTYAVPFQQRRSFVIRLRFSRPLDPRTVDGAHFTLTKTAVLDALGNEVAHVNVPAAVDVFLAQRRMGEVVVEIRPLSNLDVQSRYELRVAGTVRALDGTPMGADWVSTR